MCLERKYKFRAKKELSNLRSNNDFFYKNEDYFSNILLKKLFLADLPNNSPMSPIFV